MNQKIKDFLINFMAAWQTAKIYGTKHPMFKSSLEQAYSRLEDILAQKSQLVVGIVSGELTSGDEIFFSLTKRMADSISYLQGIGIEKIVFNQDVSRDELAKFISLLIVPQEEIKGKVVEYVNAAAIKNIEVGKITAEALRSKAGSKIDDKFSHYETCINRISKSMDEVINGAEIDVINLKFISNNIAENLMTNYQAFSMLAKTKNRDVITFRHLLNVSILAIYFSHKLGFDKKDCLSIGAAALFHDIGKFYISKKILQKPGKLSNEEFFKIKSHTILGAKILLRYVDTLTILPVVVAIEHHLGQNLKGYPQVIFPRRPHIASLIVSICDVYDALTARRSYKQDYPPEKIYEIMVKNRDRKFPSGLVNKFFEFMGVWPNNTIVALSDGRVAVVRQINEDNIFSPTVEVISTKEKEVINLSKKTNIKIQRSLNPSGEGSKYLDFI